MQDHHKVSKRPSVRQYNKKMTGSKIKRSGFRSRLCYLLVTNLIKVPSPTSCNLLFPTLWSLDRHWSRGNQGVEMICVSFTIKA